MKLPILIVLERHWDCVPKIFLQKALPSLIEQGYDTLCFEYPSDKKEMIDDEKNTIEFKDKQFTAAKNMLANKNIKHDDLRTMNASDLQKLLYLHVSSKYFNEMTLWIRELSGNEEKFRLLQAAQSKGMKLVGVDLPEKEYSLLNEINLNKKNQAIDLLDDKRINSYITHLNKLQENDRNCIFVIGQFHYQKLVEKLQQNNLLHNVIFLHPHSLSTYYKSIDDKKLLIDYALPNHKLFTNAIKSENDYKSSINKIINEIKQIIIFKSKYILFYQNRDPIAIKKMPVDITGERSCEEEIFRIKNL